MTRQGFVLPIFVAVLVLGGFAACGGVQESPIEPLGTKAQGECANDCQCESWQICHSQGWCTTGPGPYPPVCRPGCNDQCPPDYECSAGGYCVYQMPPPCGGGRYSCP